MQFPSPRTIEAIGTRLAGTGPAGTFLRFLLLHTRDPALFEVRPGALLAGGPATGAYAVAAWLFGDEHEDAQLLLDRAATSRRSVYWMAPGEPILPDRWQRETHLILTRPPDTREPAPTGDAPPPLPHKTVLLDNEDFLTQLDRLDPDLAHLVPPPSLRERFPFRFRALALDGLIVSMCDASVDDGRWLAIQQVNTAGRVRRRGLSKALVQSVIRAAGGRGILWICEEHNAASQGVAESCGLSLLQPVPLLYRSAGPTR